jgi:hypothetical protein
MYYAWESDKFSHLYVDILQTIWEKLAWYEDDTKKDFKETAFEGLIIVLNFQIL